MIVPVMASVLVTSLVQYREDREITLKVTWLYFFFPIKCLPLKYMKEYAMVGQHPVPRVLQCFQVALRMLDTCPGSAAELQREDFDRQIFQQLREDAPDLSNYPVSSFFFFF